MMARRGERAEFRLVKRLEGWLPGPQPDIPAARRAAPGRPTRHAASVSCCGAGWLASILSRLGCRRTGLIVLRIGPKCSLDPVSALLRRKLTCRQPLSKF